MTRRIHPRALPVIRYMAYGIQIHRTIVTDADILLPATVRIDKPRGPRRRDPRIVIGPRVLCRVRLTQVA